MKLSSQLAVISVIMSSGLSGCDLVEKGRKIDIPFLNNLKVDEYIIKTKEITIACGKGNLEKYTKDGWKIVNKKKTEVTCTWKVKRAKKGCNLDFDKGCRVNVPDKKGEKIIYNLEKKVSKNKIGN